MKIDIKNLIFLGLSLVFFSLWYFKNDNVGEGIISKLEIENTELRIMRESSDSAIDKLTYHIDSISKDLEVSYSEISVIKSDLDKVNKEVIKSERELHKEREKLRKQIKKYNDMKNNPPNREGEDLIKSLREKLNK